MFVVKVLVTCGTKKAKKNVKPDSKKKSNFSLFFTISLLVLALSSVAIKWQHI